MVSTTALGYFSCNSVHSISMYFHLFPSTVSIWLNMFNGKPNQ